MIIGAFIYDKEPDSFNGDISTLHFQFSPVEITPIEKSGENGPDYRLTSVRYEVRSNGDLTTIFFRAMRSYSECRSSGTPIRNFA